MKKVKGMEITTVSQFCLEATPLLNFIHKLPHGVKISNLRFRGNHNTGRKIEQLDETLKKQGLQNVIHLGDLVEVRGLMKGVVDKSVIAKSIKSISKKYKLPSEKFYILEITLMDKDNTSSLTFRRMYKSIKLPNDKRRKRLVLGLQAGSGLDYHAFLADISAKKVTCTFGKVEKTIVMCSEEAVIK